MRYKHWTSLDMAKGQHNNTKKTAIVIGAGPAGLTAAYELLHHTEIRPIIFEMSNEIGGISRTVNYKGNRIDIGGHRFFSKSDRVMRFWLNILPLQAAPARDDILLGRKFPNREQIRPENFQYKNNNQNSLPDPEKQDKVALLRNRISRVFFRRTFFDYPISLSFKTIKNLGFLRTFKIVLSYIKAMLFPIKDQRSLEHFFTNRFGKELYNTFFKDYTQKVWGVPCSQISPQWGAQRVKGLSISKAIMDAAVNLFSKKDSIAQKKTETSLIKRFMYPKFGPGQLWSEVANIVKSKGGELHMTCKVVGLKSSNSTIIEAQVKNQNSGQVTTYKADYFFSTMPVKDLILAMGRQVPKDVQEVAQGLVYRDFVTVGLLLKKLKMKNQTNIKTVNNIVPDNWIYIQEKDVRLGRLQIFNNWSPYMVKQPHNVWLGLEYFCTEGDRLWSKSDDEFKKLAVDELTKIDFIEKQDVLDSVVIRSPKTYPAYFGTYERFDTVRNYVDKFENLFLVGRNGMHRYNNQDHSMLAAMTAVDNILAGIKTKHNIWSVNAEQEYHEEKQQS